MQTTTAKYVGIGLLCACVLTLGVSMKEDASTFMGLSTKSENKIYTEFSDDEDFTSKRDAFLGTKGVNGCPNGTVPIYDHAECRTQAANLGFSYYEKYTASSDNSVVCNYCSGCDKLNTPNIIEDGGSTVRVDQSHASRAYWVCAAITAKPTAAPTASPTTASPTGSPTIPFGVQAINKEVPTGTDVTISCVVTGITGQLYEVVWRKEDGTDISYTDSNYAINVGTYSSGSQTTALTVKAAANTADSTFTCVVNNEETEKEASVKLNVFAEPTTKPSQVPEFTAEPTVEPSSWY